jgi:hypothetical protein
MNNIQIKFTPLSIRKCVYQFIRVGIEDIGNPVIMEKEIYQYFIDHDPQIRELLNKGEPFTMCLVLDEHN